MKTCPLCDTAYPEPHTRCPQDGALLLEVRELKPGTVIRGKYKVVRKLGQGGMGTVYQAEDTFLNAQMALKFLSPELSSDPSFTRRFRDEARAAFRLRHPNIVEVNALDQSDDGSLFISMEYVEGISLRSVINRMNGPLVIPGAIQIVHGISCGLGAAHSAGFVHRDIKPENIIIQRHGERVQPKILDFGIVASMEKAKAGDAPAERLSRAPILTAEYAAPEQWGFLKPEELDGRTDIYALGCVFYEMVAGRLPFHANSLEAWMDQHLKTEPVPPSTFNPEITRFPHLDDVVLWMIKKRREERPADVGQLLVALDSVVETPAPNATPSAAPGQPPAHVPVQTPPPRAVTVPDAQRPTPARAETVPMPSQPWSSTLPGGFQQQGQPQGGGWQQTPFAQWPQQPGYSQPGYAQSGYPQPPSYPQAVPAQRKSKVGLILTLVGLAAFLVLGAGTYFVFGHKSPSVNNGSTTTSSTAKQPDATVSSPRVPPVQIQSSPVPNETVAANDTSSSSGSNLGKPPAIKSVSPPPVDTKPIHAVQSPAALQQQADALYAAGSYTSAVPLLEQACTGGADISCNYLADMYSKGQGVPENSAKAVQFRTKSCDGGVWVACYRLSFNYNNGDGVTKSMPKVEELRTEACDGGVADACTKLAAMYLSEVGFKDETKAAKYYQLACDRGSREGCWFIGKMYDLGKGVPRDEVKSKELYTKSCRLGYEQGCDALKAKSF